MRHFNSRYFYGFLMFVFKENISTLIFYLDLHPFESHFLFIANATEKHLFTFFAFNFTCFSFHCFDFCQLRLSATGTFYFCHLLVVLRVIKLIIPTRSAKARAYAQQRIKTVPLLKARPVAQSKDYQIKKRGEARVLQITFCLLP